jgi:hypothetical protein
MRFDPLPRSDSVCPPRPQSLTIARVKETYVRRSSLLLSLAALVTVGAVAGAGALYFAWEPGLPAIEPPANALPFPINIRLVLAG